MGTARCIEQQWKTDLITGQNPASTEGVGQAIYDAIFG